MTLHFFKGVDLKYMTIHFFKSVDLRYMVIHFFQGCRPAIFDYMIFQGCRLDLFKIRKCLNFMGGSNFSHAFGPEKPKYDNHFGLK